MPEEIKKDSDERHSSLPRIQLAFLLLMLIVYPVLSLVMDILGATDTSEIVSKVDQVYLPTLIIQLILLSMLWFVLRSSNEPFAEIGLGRQDINRSNVVSAIIFFVGAWGLMVIIKGSMTRSGYLPPETDYLELMPSNALEGGLWTLLSVGAAMSEELIFRGFVITRLRRITGSFWIGAILGSLAFSLGHLYQGIAGVILTFLYGMLFAGLFAARRSVFPCIVAHFMQDIIALAAVFIKPG